MKTKIMRYATTIIGLLLLAAGLYLTKMNSDPQGIMRVLPYVCIGIGCGLFGHGMGEIISERAVGSDPEIQRKLKIETNDERNITIANRAKGKAFDMITCEIAIVQSPVLIFNSHIDGKIPDFTALVRVVGKHFRHLL